MTKFLLISSFIFVAVVSGPRYETLAVYETQVRNFKAWVTQYSVKDSCHYRNAKGECVMKSGRVVYAGAVACPKSLPLGTKIKGYDGKYKCEVASHTCEDRYANYLDKKRGNPTIDQFALSDPKGKELKTIYY